MTLASQVIAEDRKQASPPDWHHDHLDDHRLINGPNKVAVAVKCAAASICFILYRYLATQGDTDV